MSSQVCQDLVLAQNLFWSWPFSQRILSLSSWILVSLEFSWSFLACQGRRWAGRLACWGQGWVGRRQNYWCQTLPGELSATGQTGEFYPKQWSQQYPVCSQDNSVHHSPAQHACGRVGCSLLSTPCTSGTSRGSWAPHQADPRTGPQWGRLCSHCGPCTACTVPEV